MPLASLLRAALRRSGERTALVHGESRWSAAELDAAAERVALGLASRLEKGARVLLYMSNRAEYLILQIALERAGLVRVPANRLYTAAEVERVAEDAGASAIFCDESTRARLGGIGGLWICSVDGEAGNGPGWEALGRAEGGSLPETAPGDIASINYTSGTSGRPKGAVLTVGNWMAVYRNMLVDRDIRAEDRLAHVGPLTHASGAYAVPHLLRGAANVIVDYRAPSDLLAAIESERITVFSCVPTLLTRLVADPAVQRHDLGSLRRICYGAEPIPPNTLAAAEALFGLILVGNYGLTEAMMTVAFLSEAEHAKGERSADGLIGRPYTFVDVVLRRSDGAPVGPGETGEITIRSDHVMAGYWQRPAETAEVLKEGWLWSGDLAVAEPGGMLRLVGRSKDLVICGGFNIYPREVESVLASLPGVREAAVFGAPDEQWGERLVAVLAGRFEMDALHRAAKARLGIKTPKQWLVREELPRTANGKIDRARLKAEVTADGG
jgi:acyl-CoA synthetase (AMP-forming)/AMP-acid ligase II